MSDPIDAALAASLVAEQFPQWADLPVVPVVPGGNDNRTFRLGDELTVRLPSADGYVAGELKEHEWLGRLAPALSLPIPVVEGAGMPSATFPRPWSVRRWIPGETAEPARIRDPSASPTISRGSWSSSARRMPRADRPRATRASTAAPTLRTTTTSTRGRSAAVRGEYDPAVLSAMWDRALASRWVQPPVWFHGDVASGNLLVDEHGDLVGGDRLRHLGRRRPGVRHRHRVDALRGSARERFRDSLGLDDEHLGSWPRVGAVEGRHHDHVAAGVADGAGVVLDQLVDER